MPNNLRRLYQIYTLIAATTIFISSLLLLTGQVRTANLIIITPLVALAWINFTNPQKTSEALWSLRMLIVVFVLTALGLLAFRIQPEPAPPANCPVCTTQALPGPSTPIDSPVPSPEPASLVIGAVTITNPDGALLYLEPNLINQSQISAAYQEIYPYSDFDKGFFLITLDATRSGWVKLEDVIPRT